MGMNCGLSAACPALTRNAAGRQLGSATTRTLLVSSSGCPPFPGNLLDGGQAIPVHLYADRVVMGVCRGEIPAEQGHVDLLPPGGLSDHAAEQDIEDVRVVPLDEPVVYGLPGPRAGPASRAAGCRSGTSRSPLGARSEPANRQDRIDQLPFHLGELWRRQSGALPSRRNSQLGSDLSRRQGPAIGRPGDVSSRRGSRRGRCRRRP